MKRNPVPRQTDYAFQQMNFGGIFDDNDIAAFGLGKNIFPAPAEIESTPGISINPKTI
jgi:hypothetical protein